MESKSVYEQIRDYWAGDEGIVLLPPENECDIVAAFSRTGRLPVSNDVIQLYRVIGGFGFGPQPGNLGWDKDLFTLWTLARVREENAEEDGPDIWFADHSLSLFDFCVRYRDADHSAVGTSHSTGGNLADSVEEFLEGYLRDPEGASFGFRSTYRQ